MMYLFLKDLADTSRELVSIDHLPSKKTLLLMFS